MDYHLCDAAYRAPYTEHPAIRTSLKRSHTHTPHTYRGLAIRALLTVMRASAAHTLKRFIVFDNCTFNVLCASNFFAVVRVLRSRALHSHGLCAAAR